MIPRTTKAVLAALAAGSMALTVAGCSGGPAATTAGGKTEISFYAFQTEKALKPIIAAFHAANPDITVTPAYGSGTGGDYATTLQTRIAGKQTPDVFQIVAENRAEIVSNGIAADLSAEPVIQTVDPSWLDLYRDGDKVYGMTYTAWMGGLIYNKKLLAKAGHDTFPTTWDDFLATGKDLLDADIAPYYEEQQIASGSLTALLASSYDAAGIPSSEWVLDGRPKDKTFEQAWTGAITEWNKAISSGVMPKEQIGLKGDQIKSAFLNGEVAMFRSGNWHKAEVEKAGIDYGFAAFPAYPGGKTFINGGGDPGYAVSASASEQKMAAAKKFINFLGSAEGVKMLVEGQGAMSISSNYKSDPGATFKDAYENNLQTGRKYWLEWSKGSTALTAAMVAQQQQLFQGQTTPADFAKKMDAESAKA